MGLIKPKLPDLDYHEWREGLLRGLIADAQAPLDRQIRRIEDFNDVLAAVRLGSSAVMIQPMISRIPSSAPTHHARFLSVAIHAPMPMLIARPTR